MEKQCLMSLMIQVSYRHGVFYLRSIMTLYTQQPSHLPVPVTALSTAWVCGLSLAEMWVRIPSGAWMFVCCECCVLSGRNLCDELITCPEESYRLWCVVVCDLETSWMRRPWPTGGCRTKNIQTNKHTKSVASVDRCLCKTISTVASILKKPCLCLNFLKLPERCAERHKT